MRSPPFMSHTNSTAELLVAMLHTVIIKVHDVTSTVHLSMIILLYHFFATIKS